MTRGPRYPRTIANGIVGRPYVLLGVVVALAGLAVPFVLKLRLDTGFSALLPDDEPVVREVRQATKRVGGGVELVIALSGDAKARLRLARRLVARLAAKPYIRRADVEYPAQFFERRKLLLMPMDALRRLELRVQREVEKRLAKSNPLFVDLGDDDDAKDKGKGDGKGKGKASLLDELRRLDRQLASGEKSLLLRETFTSPDGRYLFVRVLPMGGIASFEKGGETLAAIKREVAALQPSKHGLGVRYAGGLALNQEQHQRMGQDLGRAGLIAAVLILSLLLLYTRRAEAVLVLALPLGSGLLITLAVTQVGLGQLNLVSGFLVTALIGLGIDFGIHLYLGYLERLRQGAPRHDAMRDAIVDTLPGCLTSALTTAAAFFAMTLADFRGFSEYGLIAGLGVLVALAATYLALPGLALLLTRRASSPRWKPSSRSMGRAPALTVIGIGLALTAFSASQISKLRYHNDFNALRGSSPTVELSDEVDRTLGSLGPAAIVVESLTAAEKVSQRLAKQQRRAGSLILRHASLSSLVPDEPRQRAALLARMHRSLSRLSRSRLGADEKKALSRGLALTRVSPYQAKDVPATYRRQLMTPDGKSYLVLVWPRSSLYDDADVMAWGHFLTTFQQDLRAAGVNATVLDENRVAARVLTQMRRDGPRVLAYAAIAVLLLLLIDFRDLRRVALVGGTLAVGMLWFCGLLAFYGFEINVFNQAVIPSVLGLGIDNAVHLQHRYSAEGRGSVALVLATSGAAAMLATATTAIGFGAAIVARHAGIETMGMTALVGFGSVFVATTVAFPALLRLLEGRARTP